MPCHSPAASSALLWDLDNVAPPHEHLRPLAETLCALVAPDAPRIAAGHRTTCRTSAGILGPLGIQIRSGGNRRNGADTVLMEQARALGARGIHRFLVASNDHQFRQIAAFAEVHVLTLHAAYVSLRLCDVARSITVLEHGTRGWSLRVVGFGGRPNTGAEGSGRTNGAWPLLAATHPFQADGSGPPLASTLTGVASVSN